MFQTLNTNILTFPQYDETSTGVGQPSIGYKEERIGEEELCISNYGERSGSVKDEEQICKEKSVSELSVGLLLLLLLL
jgi:hypothetical protein